LKRFSILVGGNRDHIKTAWVMRFVFISLQIMFGYRAKFRLFAQVHRLGGSAEIAGAAEAHLDEY
jgi:hypothetical protein